MKEMKQDQNNHKKKKKRILISQVILAFLLLVLLLFNFRCGRNDAPAVSEYEQNVNAITEIDYSEQQQAIDAIVEEGKMNVNYSPKAVFEGKTSVLFNVKNIKNNHSPIVFSIYDEEGICIYKSKKIEQGYEMTCIELEKELTKGIHQCKLKVGYAEEGNVSSAFPLTIEVR